MADIKTLNEKLDSLQAALDAEQEQIKSAIDKLNIIIAELQTGGGTVEERQALADKIDAVKTDLEGTITEETPGE